MEDIVSRLDGSVSVLAVRHTTLSHRGPVRGQNEHIDKKRRVKGKRKAEKKCEKKGSALVSDTSGRSKPQVMLGFAPPKRLAKHHTLNIAYSTRLEMGGDEACNFLAHLDTLYPGTHKLLVLRPEHIDPDTVAHAIETDSDLPGLISGSRVYFDDSERVALHIGEDTDAVLLSRRSMEPCNAPYSLILYVLVVLAAAAILHIAYKRLKKMSH